MKLGYGNREFQEGKSVYVRTKLRRKVPVDFLNCQSQIKIKWMDSKSIAMVKTVFDDQGEPFFACSCDDQFLPSGCKGKVCVHMVMALIKSGKITVRAKDRNI